MILYRIYFCDSHGKILSADDFEATDDAVATERARMLVNGRVQIFEVWAPRPTCASPP